MTSTNMAENKKIDKEEKQISFRIVEIKRLSYFENAIQDIESLDKEKLPVNLGTNLHFDEDSDIIAVEFKAVFAYLNEEDNKKRDLFGIVVLYRFEVKDLKERFKNKETGNYEIPDSILNILLGITVSGTRGMLVELITNPQYKNIYLPPINLSSITQGFKK